MRYCKLLFLQHLDNHAVEYQLIFCHDFAFNISNLESPAIYAGNNKQFSGNYTLGVNNYE
jgi:hypothetical protein